MRALPLALSNLGVLCLFIVGFLLLFVPGFIALTRYYLVLPACMAEDLGHKAIFARSAQLTEGARWRVFALALFGLLPPILVDAGLQWIPDERAALVVHDLAGSLAGAYSAVIGGLAYLELRRLKEGTDNDKLARVFD